MRAIGRDKSPSAKISIFTCEDSALRTSKFLKLPRVLYSYGFSIPCSSPLLDRSIASDLNIFVRRSGVRQTQLVGTGSQQVLSSTSIVIILIALIYFSGLFIRFFARSLPITFARVSLAFSQYPQATIISWFARRIKDSAVKPKVLQVSSAYYVRRRKKKGCARKMNAPSRRRQLNFVAEQ